MTEVATPERGPSLITKLAEVMASVDRIPKRGRNEFHKYDYVMEADLVDAVRGELAKRHIMIIPSMISRETKPLGDRMTLTSVMMRYQFLDGETGETLDVTMPGDGSDTGDKGVYKAMTGATKYMLMKTFLIATGDDPEHDGVSQPAKRSGKVAPASESTRQSEPTPARQNATGPETPPPGNGNRPSYQPLNAIGMADIMKGNGAGIDVLARYFPAGQWGDVKTKGAAKTELDRLAKGAATADGFIAGYDALHEAYTAAQRTEA